jgi:FixJ family two-component response regulator
MPIAHSRLVVEELLDGLSPIMREVVERKLQGYTVREIAHTLLISHRAVERLLQAIRLHFADLFERSADAAPQAPVRLRRTAEKSNSQKIAGKPRAGAGRIRIA